LKVGGSVELMKSTSFSAAWFFTTAK